MRNYEYFKFILLVVQLPQRMDAYMLRNKTGKGCMKTSYSHTNADITDDVGLKHLGMNNDALTYIVMIITEVSQDHMMAYHRRVCSGTMISDNMVLTLASCILSHNKEVADPKDTKIYERPTSNILQALKIYIRGAYRSEDREVSKSNDFCIILVEKSTQTVFPRIPEHFEEFRDIKNTCVIGGYGVSGTDVSLSNFQFFYLNRTKVKVFSGSGCNSKSRICVHFGSVITCKEDRGSPVVCNGVLYAIYAPKYNSFSAQSECLDIYVSAFSPVYHVKAWVDQYKNNEANNLEWLNSPLAIIILCFVVFFIMGGIYYGLVEVLQRKLDPVDGTQSRSMRVGTVDSRDVEEDTMSDSLVWSSS